MPPFMTREQRAEMLICLEGLKQSLAWLNKRIPELKAELRHVEGIWRTWV